jgi:hypothetical protein
MLKEKKTEKKTKKEKLQEQAETQLIANQYGPGFEHKSSGEDSTNIKVTSRPASQKTIMLQIGDYSIEVVNPQYVTDLERNVDALEKRLKNVENNTRRLHTHQNKIVDDLNKTKRDMPKW